MLYEKEAYSASFFYEREMKAILINVNRLLTNKKLILLKKIVILVTISAMIHNKGVNKRFTVSMCNDKGR